jgi:hypothetical protein
METESMDLQKLEKANPIIQVAIELGIKVQGNMGKCFKKDRHILDSEKQTLFFNLAKNSFHCRECQDVGGNVLDLVCQSQGWDRQRAIEWLAHRVEFDEFTKKLYHGKGRKKLSLHDDSR